MLGNSRNSYGANGGGSILDAALAAIFVFMPAENILVIAVDGLRAAALGAYGNTAYSTPALDALAAESLLFDWWFADAAGLPEVYRSYWRSADPLPLSLAERGYSTTLVTDMPEMMAFEGACEFDRCIQLPAVPAARADDASQTALARLFAAAYEQLEASAQASPRFVWVHSSGMYGPWDAPLALQERLLERGEGDPAPADTVEPPDLMLDDAGDPDAAFRWSCAYAAQIMLLDTCVDGLRQSLEETWSREPWFVVFCGVRGFPLGEHGKVGGVDGRLHAEQLQVPMLWRFSDGSRRLSRSSQLASHSDLAPLPASRMRGDTCMPARDALIAVGPQGIRAIRTADWSLRCEPHDPAVELSADPSRSRCELYVRPDDRWEANDVAGLCPEVVEKLLAQLRSQSTRGSMLT